MSSDIVSQPSLARYAVVAILGMVILGTGIAFRIRGGSSTTTYVDKSTEIIACTATGGLAKYAYCNWHEPSDNAGSGSIITAIYYMVGKNPTPIGVDIVSGCGATLSGANVIANFTNIQTSTGAFFRNTSGSILVTEGDYVRAVTLSNPTSAHKASLIIEYISRLTR